MSQWWSRVLGLTIVLFFQACSNNIDELNAITKKYDITKDVGEGIKIIYSDSAEVKLIIEAPILERYNDVAEPKDVFPKGILISFLNDSKVPTSWLKADYAVRNPRTQTMTAKGNVVFYNIENDRLQSSELIWDEANKKIYTEKFIRITQPSKGDTIYGMGFQTDPQFKIIEIKQRVKAKIRSSNVPD
jgi:LPS export ABC transporter protein LptC